MRTSPPRLRLEKPSHKADRDQRDSEDQREPTPEWRCACSAIGLRDGSAPSDDLTESDAHYPDDDERYACRVGHAFPSRNCCPSRVTSHACTHEADMLTEAVTRCVPSSPTARRGRSDGR